MLLRPLAVLSALALATAGLAAEPAHAASSPVTPRTEPVGSAAPAGDLTAVLELAQTPAQAARLSALSRTRLHPTQARSRVAEAATLAPGVAARDRASRFATDHGLHVLHADSWSVTVSGVPDRIASVFGTGLTRSTVRGRSYVPASSTPAVPAALRGTVSDVVGLDDRPAMHPHSSLDGDPTTQDGNSLRTAYSVPSAWRGKGVTVATYNLSGWDSGDFYDYSRLSGNPTTSATLTEIPVDGVDPRKDQYGGDGEVALDAETLLATAPEAHQRAYIGINTDPGAVNLVNAMATDAEAGKFQVFTTSWGQCEKYYTASSRTAFSKAVERMLAVGVTVFAASGDAGAYDCSLDAEGDPDNTILAVDFPASDPGVVGAGGTTLPTSAGQTETTWSSPRRSSDASDYQGDGSGGGFSQIKARPAYQGSLGLPGSGRAVPDVASDSDPQTGLTIVYKGQLGAAGGTSLASPTWAGFTAAALSATTRPATGFGNILPTLYTNPSAFRDITTGDNHHFAAGTGYDQATGLGAPRWVALGPLLAGSPALTARPYSRYTTIPVTVTPPAGSTFSGYRIGEGPSFADCSPTSSPFTSTPPSSYVLAAATQGRHTLSLDAVDGNGTCHATTADVRYDTVAPTTKGAVGLLTGLDTRAKATWSGVDATSPVTSYDVLFATSGGTVVFTANGTVVRSRSTAALVQGATYRLTVKARDAAGNVSPPVQTLYTVPRDDRFLRLSSGWSRVSRSYDFLGSNLQSATRGASATFSGTGREIRISVLKSTGGGYLDAYVDGVRHRYDLHSSTLLARYQLVLARFSTSAAHSVKLVVVGAHSSSSSGSTVYVDSVRAAP